MPFPERLRELRKAARLSQRALAEKVGVDFTYLSKIENGRVEPPSESVLQRIAKELAGELGMDEIELSDELITLAGKIPSDLAETLSRNPEVIRFLRSVGDDVRSPDDWRRLFSSQSRQETPGEE
jgi:transcriptional regulator with XRE-family HTH domain